MTDDLTDSPVATFDASAIPASLDALLRASVERYGDRVLLDYFEQERTVTYAGLAGIVDETVRRLAGAGLGRGARVGVLLPNVPLFPALTFALARLGAVCVPINVRYTASELDFVAGDAGLEWFIADRDLLDGVRASSFLQALAEERLVVGGADAVELGAPIGDAVTPDATDLDATDLDDVTHIQYTSGTTGFPKGCLLTQRYWLTASASYEYARPAPQRPLEDSPYFYMSGPLLLVSAMWSGATVLIPRSASLRRFLGWLVDQRVDWCWFPPQLLKYPASDLDRAHGLRHASVYLAEPAEVDEIERRYGVLVRDGWSMTETGFGTYVPAEAGEMMRAQSIGVPMPGREFRIVDDEGADVAEGDEGQLCVRGPGTFLGYHNRPDANVASFLDGGWFLTGDRARRDERGWLYFLGRQKDMVRRSGENIACAEVEAVLRRLPEVLDCAVLAVPDAWRDEEVKAYLVLVEGQDASTLPPAEVFEFAASHLASFKVPRYLEYRDELPLTPSDKVAKGELRDEKADLRTDSFDRVDGIWR